ncbi:MAG: adenine deaminase C-terminal domain-containing protein, partial [Chitinophagaceae bacterium]
CTSKQQKKFSFVAVSDKVRAIEALDGELITNNLVVSPVLKSNLLLPDVENDLLKLTVVNRYRDTEPAIAFIKNFGIKSGAIASSVAHDSHNIIAVGTNDEFLCRAVNLLIENKGGICAINEREEKVLPLPVAGLMSDEDGYEVARQYASLDKMAKAMGSQLRAPFMTLSFMALLVIPHLKLSDKGLFDGDKFEYATLSYSE